jgi:tetratricopeptide (TPR) repeat protein
VILSSAFGTNRSATCICLQSHADEAVRWLEKARNLNWPHSMIRADLAAAYGFVGDTERAAAELAEARRLSPDDRYSSLARLRAVYTWGVPKIRDLREATYFVGMRKAGMPERSVMPPSHSTVLPGESQRSGEITRHAENAGRDSWHVAPLRRWLR